MSVVSEINNIYEFSKETQNEDFKNFANSLLCFCESKKGQTNINDIESFSNLIKKELNADAKHYDESLSYLIKTLKEQGFIEYEKFYKNFQERLQINNEESQEQKDLRDEIQSELLINDRLSNLKREQEQLESLDKNNENLNNENLTKTIPNNSYETTIESQESKNTLAVSPNDMIMYIKDEKSIMFPFDKKDTLENPAFLSAFYANLNTRSNQELESLIEQVRAKNEALRAELRRLQEQNRENLQKSLQQGVQDNANLSQELTQNTKANLTKAQTNVLPKQEANIQKQQPPKPPSQNTYAQINAKLDQAEKNQEKNDENIKKMRQMYAIKNAKEKKAEKESESDVEAFERALELSDKEVKESQNKIRKQK